MKHLSIFITVPLMLVVAAGCGCHRHLPPATEHRDSVSVIYKDSTIYHIDTIYAVLPDQRESVVMPSSERSHLENDVASSDAYVDSLGQLHHSLNSRPTPLPLAVPVPTHTITTDLSASTSSTTTVTEYIDRPLSRWQTFWIRTGKVLLAVMLLSVAVWLFRRTCHHI